MNGVPVGDISNNGTSNTDYASSIATHTAPPAYGPFQGGASSGMSHADFDQSYDAINGLTYDSTAQSYTVQAGDTLSAIAQALWGDASLWYLIADANGLSGSEPLAPGRLLTLPNKVHNLHNNATTWRPYDPNQAQGDLSPTDARKPRSNKCGVFGQILAAVVAVAVAAIVDMIPVVGPILAPYAANAAQQGVLIATGNQDKFSWKSLGTVAVDQFLPKTGNAFLDNAITQKVSMKLGLQDKFSWAGVATAGITAAVAQGVGAILPPGTSATVQHLAVNTAAYIASAAATSLITGEDFGDTLAAALPSVIGQTVGQLAANGIANAFGSLDRGSVKDELDSFKTRAALGEAKAGYVKTQGLSWLDTKVTYLAAGAAGIGYVPGQGYNRYLLPQDLQDGGFQGPASFSLDPSPLTGSIQALEERYANYRLYVAKNTTGDTKTWGLFLGDKLNLKELLGYDFGPQYPSTIQGYLDFSDPHRYLLSPNDSGAPAGFYGGTSISNDSGYFGHIWGAMHHASTEARERLFDQFSLSSVATDFLHGGPMEVVGNRVLGAANWLIAPLPAAISEAVRPLLPDTDDGVAAQMGLDRTGWVNGNLTPEQKRDFLGQMGTALILGPRISGRVIAAERTAVGGAADLPSGSFSISDWSGYPAGVPRPQGPFRIVEGAEYNAARDAANNANRAIRREQGLVGQPVDVHEIQPVKFGGSPTDPANKVVLPRDVHRQQVTPWWNQFQRDIGH